MQSETTRKLVLLAVAVALVAAAPAAHAQRQAVTMWWVIFNNPDGCEDGCDGTDLANPAAEPSVVYATGQVSRANGRLQLVGSLYEQASGFSDDLIGGPGLLDAEGAEIHMVVRTHGRPVRFDYLEQITQFLDRNCEDAGGSNVCEDIQFTIFQSHQSGTPSDVVWFPHINNGNPVRRASSTLYRSADGVRVVLESSLRR